jgi:hemolysin III
MYRGERFNSISHLVGTVFALVALIILIVQTSRQGDPWKIVSCTIYGTTLLILYTSSTLYHSFQGRTKKLFRSLDHLSIYLLIAGSYTPLTLVTLRGGWGWTLFGLVWGLALAGILLESFSKKRKYLITLLIYVSMGWLVLIAVKPLVQTLPSAGLFWLVLGGLFYTVGIVFYVFDKKVRHFHGIWHLFVLAGSLCHFITIFFYVI